MVWFELRSFHAYILIRILTGIVSLFLLLSFVFVVLRILPGDPIEIILPEQAPEWFKEQVRHELGLDKPIYLQFADYLVNLFHGDLGKSIWSRRSVINEITDRFPTSLELALVAVIISLALGILGGVYSALRRNTIIDHLLRVGSIITFSIPVFVIGILLQLLFSVYLGWFPVYGRNSEGVMITRITGLNIIDSIFTLNLNGLLDSLKCLVLPVISLSCFLTPTFLRMTRASMIDVLGERYITVAIAKGLPKRVVVFKHCFRNAILPIVTTGAMYFILVLGSAILTESIFGFPGMGRLLVDAASMRDFPVVQGCVIVYCVLVIVVSIAIDIICSFLDPRIRVTSSD